MEKDKVTAEEIGLVYEVLAGKKTKCDSFSTSGRGESKQDYETPGELIDAVEKRFGKLVLDLASNEKNFKAPLYITTKSLELDWHTMADGNFWLNPPFEDNEPWSKKCRNEAECGASILLLTPASVDSNWFLNNIAGNADVHILKQRVKYVGMKDPYPKACMVSHFFPGSNGDIFIWDWKKDILLKGWTPKW
jgi:hypothetical protein